MENSSVKKIPITKPFFGEAEEKAVVEVLRSGWIVQGPKVKEFEDMFASYCGVKHAVATTSCTTALHLGLVTLGVGPGDEVILPSFTFIATANAVEYCGAKPVFCDIDLRTFNIDIDAIENFITRRTKAIIPVSLFGLPVDMPKLMGIANHHGLKVIEDAACATGSKINEKHVGSLGSVASVFSFHPRKIITTGEGGMLVTDSGEILQKVRSLRDHGALRSDLERHNSTNGACLSAYDILGYNYRMTDIQGAIGIEQMTKLDNIVKARCKIAQLYNNILNDVDWLIPPYEPKGWKHSYQSYVVLFSGGDRLWPKVGEIKNLSDRRNRVMTYMEKNGISVRQGTHSVHRLGYYKTKYGLKDEDFPNSYIADLLSLALPLYVGITKEEAGYVVNQLKLAKY